MKKKDSKMTFGEWCKTPAGKKAMRKRHELMKKNFMPDLEKTMQLTRRIIEDAKPITRQIIEYSKPVTMTTAPLLRYSPYKEQSKFLTYFDGNFCTRGKLIDFRDPSFNYALIIKALLLQSDKSGFLSYEKINKFLERAGKRRIKDRKKQIERITNALVSLKRDRKRQKNPFPLELSDGSPVIRTVPGRGLMINK